jgi:hypothetical protein
MHSASNTEILISIFILILLGYNVIRWIIGKYHYYQLKQEFLEKMDSNFSPIDIETLRNSSLLNSSSESIVVTIKIHNYNDIVDFLNNNQYMGFLNDFYKLLSSDGNQWPNSVKTKQFDKDTVLLIAGQDKHDFKQSAIECLDYTLELAQKLESINKTLKVKYKLEEDINIGIAVNGGVVSDGYIECQNSSHLRVYGEAIIFNDKLQKLIDELTITYVVDESIKSILDKEYSFFPINNTKINIYQIFK